MRDPTPFGPLIDARGLQRLLGSEPVVLDVRWDLAAGARRDLYERGHIPSAAFVDLDSELAAPAGKRGRHPLPSTAEFESAMQAVGVSADRDVVVYDAATGTAAARAWWLLRYFGHAAVALLDGGLAAWLQEGLPIQTGPSGPAPGGDFVARPGAMPVLDADGAAELARSGVLLDARASERYAGEREPIDPVAGHIPGASSRPAELNLDDSGRFRRSSELRSGFEALGVGPGVQLGAYCGSGVTAAHQVLALELAGHRAALYAGSWSEWITDPDRPVAVGRQA